MGAAPWPGLLTAGILFALYWWTIAPSISALHDNVDSAELVAVASVGGVAHPPGSAIWLPLGWATLQTLEFVEEPALRTNLLSAVSMAAAGGLLAVAVIRWRPETPGWAAVLGGLLAGFAPIPWAQALVTEVLALQALLTAIALALAPSAARGRGWPAFALVLGLLAWNHPTGLAVAVPLAAACLLLARPPRHQAVLTLAMFTLPGLFTVAYLWWRADAAIAWGDTSSLAGIWDHLTGRVYQGAIERSPAVVLEAVPETLRRALRQLPPPAWPLVALGAVALGRARPALATALGVSVLLLVVFVSAYRATGRQDYLATVVFIAAIPAAYGAAEVWRWLEGRLPSRGSAAAAALGLWALVALWVVMSGDQVSRRGDTALRDAAVTLLQAQPPRAVIETTLDEDTFPLWYAHVVLGERPDVTIRDVRGIAPVIGPGR